MCCLRVINLSLFCVSRSLSLSLMVSLSVILLSMLSTFFKRWCMHVFWSSSIHFDFFVWIKKNIFTGWKAPFSSREQQQQLRKDFFFLPPVCLVVSLAAVHIRNKNVNMHTCMYTNSKRNSPLSCSLTSLLCLAGKLLGNNNKKICCMPYIHTAPRRMCKKRARTAPSVSRTAK